MSNHEPVRAHRAIAKGSNRVFGLVVGGFFGLVGLWPALWRGEPPRLPALGAAAVLVGLGLFAPQRLERVNQLWFGLGRVLHAIVSPLIMAILFFFAVTPAAWLLRLFGKDPLRLAPGAESYWIPREPHGIAEGSMKNQF